MSEDAPKGRITARLVDPRQIVCVECACGALTMVKHERFTQVSAVPPRCSEEACGAPLVISNTQKQNIARFVLESPRIITNLGPLV